MLKLKLQYFGHLIRTAISLEKSLMLGKIEGRRRRGGQRMRWLDGITDAMDKNLANFGRWWGTWRSGVLQSMGLQRVGHNWVTEEHHHELSTFPLPGTALSILYLIIHLILPPKLWGGYFHVHFTVKESEEQVGLCWWPRVRRWQSVSLQGLLSSVQFSHSESLGRVRLFATRGL